MAGWMSFLLVASASMIVMTECRALPAAPISVMLDAHGNPLVFLREKRTTVHPYPQRAMMFTGYYRPVRRSNNGGQATGVFAQGNAVSGEAFFGGPLHTPHLKSGPEPLEEPEVSSAEAQAAPAADETYNEEEGSTPQEHHAHHQGHHRQEEHHHEHRHQKEEEDEQHHHHQQDSLTPQEHHEQTPLTTEVAPEEPIASQTEVPVARPKVHSTKKTPKKPVIVDDEDDDDEDDEEEDQPIVPFVPFKGSRRRQGYPNLNNFFPMIFSFPRVASRAGSSGSPPGTITAIANSYSTGKGGVASSVATAYGGSPTGKKRRAQPSEE